MKKYESLEIKFINFNKDVITASGSCTMCRPEDEILNELCTCYPNNSACKDR